MRNIMALALFIFPGLAVFPACFRAGRLFMLVSVAALLSLSCARGAITSISFPSPTFRPSELAPVQASQAELSFLLDADRGSYEVTAFRSGGSDIAASLRFTHNPASGSTQTHSLPVPLVEGSNSFFVTVRDRSTPLSSAVLSSTDTAVITRDLQTAVYRVTLDALSPYNRTTSRSTVDIEFTINGTAASYFVEVRRLGAVVSTATVGAGANTLSAVPLVAGENPLYLRVRGADTYSDVGAWVESNIVTIVYDDTDPVINNLAVAFPVLPTGDAVVSIQGDTEPYALVTVDNGAGETYQERANDIGAFSILGVDLPFSPPGPTVTSFSVTARDYAGRVSPVATVSARRDDADPRFDFVQMYPPDGWYMRPDEAIHIQGSVGDILGPFTVRFYARAGVGMPLLEEIIDDLNPGTAFEKDISLAPDPTMPGTDIVYSIEAEVESANGLTGRHFLGEVVLDVQDPPAPLFSDTRFDSIYYTNAPKISIEGSVERWSSVFFSNWHGVTYQPGSMVYSEATNAAAGAEFRSTIDISTLPEEQLSLEVTVVATSTRTGPGSRADLLITRDTTPPVVDGLTIDGEPESTGRERFVSRAQVVTFRVLTSEYMTEAPEVNVTEPGSDALPAVLTSVVEPGRIFEYTYGVQMSDDFNGPVDLVISGGTDRAGNVLMPEYRAEKVLVVDTLPPVVSAEGTWPADGSVVNSAPSPLRVVLKENPESADPASGVDIEHCSIDVFGPLEVDPSRRQSGTLTRYAPSTLEFRFDAGRFEDEGTYQVVVNGVDHAGNTTAATLVLRLDKTPISNLFIEQVVPAENTALNEVAMPVNLQGRQFVSVRFDPGVTSELDLSGSLLRLDHFCPVPFAVDGTLSTSGDDGLFFTLDRNFAVDGSADGVYTISVQARDRAGNLSPVSAFNFIYDTVEPMVLDGWNNLRDYGIEAEDSFFPKNGSIVRGPLRHVSATVVDGVAPRPNEFTGSGINTSLTSGADIELVLVEAHPTTSVPPGTSTTNTISNALKFVSVVPPVFSPCYPGVRKATVMRELFVDPVTAEPMGLTTAGHIYDGEWELRVTPKDAAGNVGTTAYARFTYDTVPPEVSLNIITNGEWATGSTLVTSGSAWDNNKTNHDTGQGLARVSIRLEALDDWGGTTAPALIDWSDAILPPNADLVPAETVLNWRFSGRIPAYDGRGRLIVRALDKAGNDSYLTKELTIHSDPLDAPRLLSPANGSNLPGAVVEFVWTRVEGASEYLCVLRDPSNNKVEKKVDFYHDRVSFNLANREEGVWTWTVYALDTAGSPGFPAQAFSFALDDTRPSVVRIFPFDGTVPDAQAGTMFDGQVRIGISFSEPMDTVTTSPYVLFQPADRTVAATEVKCLSYIQGEWRGVVDIPPSPDAPDYNGLGTVVVSGACDRAGNMIEPVSEVFEVDLGPWFAVKAFANPVLKREILFFVRCHAYDGGPLEQLAEAPHMEVKQQDAAKQTVYLSAFQPSVYRGVYTIDQEHPGDAVLLITGTDLEGNTTTRRLTFSVSNIIAADRFSATFGGFLSVRLPENSVSQNTCLAVFPSGTSDDTTSNSELRVLRRFGAVPQGPLHLLRSGTARCTLSPGDLVSGDAPVGLFVRSGSDWLYQPGVKQGDTLVCSVQTLGEFILAADTTPPEVEAVELSPGDGELGISDVSSPVRLRISDGGAGVDWESVIGTIDDAPAEMGIDRDSGTVALTASRSLSPGRHDLSLRVSDKLGNTRTWSVSLLAPESISIPLFLPVPNPARGPVTLHWKLSRAGDSGQIRIYDSSGSLVRRMEISSQSAGAGQVVWDITDKRGVPVANGVYFARLKFRTNGESATATTKIAILR